MPLKRAAGRSASATRTRVSAAALRRACRWTRFTDEELLRLRFCDLRLAIERSALARHVRRLYADLARRGLDFRPHVWLSEEWFSPDGVPGIAVPSMCPGPHAIVRPLAPERPRRRPFSTLSPSFTSRREKWR